MSESNRLQETTEFSSRRSSRRLSSGTIESSVTRLLVSTKHLLESLTQWSRKEADDKYVSDAYVKLGNDFRAASRAFTNAGVDFSDIGDVPQALRIILEAALSESPSPESLDRFLPNIRNIIVTLLQNLKNKQIRARTIATEKPRAQEKTESSPRTSKLLSAESLTRRLNADIEVPSSSTQRGTNEPNDALSQLQSGNFLQRRASKRYSAYQYAKLTSISPGSINSSLPTLQVPDDDAKPNVEVNVKPSEVPIVASESQKNTKHIYLRLQDSTKKAIVHGGVSFASLRLLFVEKFAYSPGLDPFPSIYITDPQSTIAYELEEHHIGGIAEGSLLSLKVPSFNETSHQELINAIETIRNDHTAAYADLLSKLSIIAKQLSEVAPTSKADQSTATLGTPALKELASLQQLLGSLKTLQLQFKHSTESEIDSILEKVKKFQENGLNVSESSNDAYMKGCHSKLSEESDLLLTKVDDLQDLMEAMRKDVAKRGVRIGEKQLKNTHKQIFAARDSLKSMSEYISRERTIWKRIWEAELDKVCEEQQFFNLQGELTLDLEHDLKKIEKTFDLIEQCSLEQSKQSQNKNKFFVPLMEPGETLDKVKDAILTSVVALNPDHERRVDAITRAEKLRDRERELMRKDQFQEELEDFVGDKKFKNAVGIDEIERLRQERDSENLKSSLRVPLQ